MTFIQRSIQALLVLSSLLAGVCAIDAIDLGAASEYAVLAGSAVTSAGQTGTVVYGNVGVNPGSAVDGFPPAECYGTIDAGNAAAGAAQSSLTAAYNEAAGRPTTTILSGQGLGGMTLAQGVYTFSSTAELNGMLTLDAQGNANSVWIFQVASAFNVVQSSSMIFKDSIGSAENVYWQVGATATINHNAAVVGNFMAMQAVTLDTGASVVGRLLARNAAVTLDFNFVKIPDYLIFNSNITVSGVTTATITTNGQNAIISTAATCMGIDADRVEYVSSVPTQSAARRALRAVSPVDLLATYDHLVLIRTALSLSSTTYTSTTEMYNALSKKLSDAVKNGEFTTTLQANAVTFNAPELTNASGTTVISDNPDAPSSSKNSDDELSTGAIIGIVIGGVAFLVICAVLLYYCCCRSPKSSSSVASG